MSFGVSSIKISMTSRKRLLVAAQSFQSLVGVPGHRAIGDRNGADIGDRVKTGLIEPVRFLCHGFLQFFPVYGFCDVSVHARRETSSRSPRMAWAVIAIIGMGDPCLSLSTDGAAASKPSISGICTSIRTRSNPRPSLARVAKASLPFPLRPRYGLLSQTHHQGLVHQVVLGQQECELRRLRAGMAGDHVRAFLGSLAEEVRMASTSSDCLMGLTR